MFLIVIGRAGSIMKIIINFQIIEAATQRQSKAMKNTRHGTYSLDSRRLNNFSHA
jgi:hypothetical protein